jgi:hypothetical protein
MNSSIYSSLLNSNMLFDGSDGIFDSLFDDILTHLTHYLTAVSLSTYTLVVNIS